MSNIYSDIPFRNNSDNTTQVWLIDGPRNPEPEHPHVRRAALDHHRHRRIPSFRRNVTLQGCFIGVLVTASLLFSQGSVGVAAGPLHGGATVIYTLTASNDLMWYRHDGRNDGSFLWAAPEGKKVGAVGTFKHIFAGDNGVIYVIDDSNNLMWYKHDGY